MNFLPKSLKLHYMTYLFKKILIFNFFGPQYDGRLILDFIEGGALDSIKFKFDLFARIMLDLIVNAGNLRPHSWHVFTYYQIPVIFPSWLYRVFAVSGFYEEIFGHFRMNLIAFSCFQRRRTRSIDETLF